MRKNQVSEQIRSTNRRNIRPMAEAMESRELMAVDLANIATNPDGIKIKETSSGLGTSVALVGDVNNDTFQDFLIGNPVSGYATLVFGSKNMFGLDNTEAQRSALAMEVASGRTISGVTFRDSSQPNSEFGFSVAAAGFVNNDNIPDFLIGSPNAYSADGTTARAGRAYLVMGSTKLNDINVVDLKSPDPNVQSVTFVNSLNGSRTGSSVSRAGNSIGTGEAVAIGAQTANTFGQVYVVSNSELNSAITSQKPIDLAQVGNTTGPRGLLITGSSSFQGTGTSVSFTNFDNDSVTDIVVGSPYGSTPSATLIYGTSSLNAKTIALSSVGTTQPGITFTGQLNDLTGFSVSTGGDFNGDNNLDLIIGSPNYNSGTGRASLFYGTSGSSNRVIGTYPLESVPIKIGPAIFIGKADSQTGYSVSTAGYVNNDLTNGSGSKANYSEILIGARFWATSGQGRGQTFLIPGNPGLYGTNLQLVGAETNEYILAVPLYNSSITSGSEVGTSVSGIFRTPQSSPTVDNDAWADFVIGGPAGTSSNGYLIEGAYIQDQIPKTPKANIIITQIGVDDVPKTNFTYKVNATTPSAMKIYVLSQKSAPTLSGEFKPLTDIVAASVIVNGVKFTGASLSATTPADLNNDGIPDAIVTITPRSNLNLTNGSGKLTISGSTTDGQIWTGTANILVTGGAGPSPTPGPNPVAGGVAYAQYYNDKYNPPVNGEASVPKARALSKLFWKPLSYNAAYGQYLPNKYFQMRQGIAFGTANPANVQAVINQRRNLNNRVNPINGHKSVFMRGRTYAGMKLKSTSPTIPPLG